MRELEAAELAVTALRRELEISEVRITAIRARLGSAELQLSNAIRQVLRTGPDPDETNGPAHL